MSTTSNSATVRMAEAVKHINDTTNNENISGIMTIEPTGIRVAVFFEVEGRVADAGKLVSFADLDNAEVNPLVLAIDAALSFVGAA